jgi:hypothetical protein
MDAAFKRAFQVLTFTSDETGIQLAVSTDVLVE